MTSKLVRVSIEIVCWAMTLTLVAALSSCDSEQATQAAQQEAGTQQQCLTTGEDKLCRSPDGISRQ